MHAGPARWLLGNYHHLSQTVSPCLSALWGIHHALSTWRGPHLVYVPGRADKSPGYHGEHSTEGSIPWQQGRGALLGLYTHTHTDTNPPGRLNHLGQQAPSWASRAFPRVPWPSCQVPCHEAATRPPAQQQPCSSVDGIFHARVQEWVAIAVSGETLYQIGRASCRERV